MAELYNDKKLPLVDELPRRVDRGRAHRHRAEVAHGRSRHPDGVAVQADRAREPHLAQHERALQGQGAQGDGPGRGPQGVARPSPRGADPPLQASARADRAPPRSAGRLAGRLSQPRQGHQDHPQRGRAQARPDEDLQAHRRAGRRHPQHAAAQLAQARRDGDQDARTRSWREEKAGDREADPLREGAVEDGRRSGQGRCARPSARRRRSASAAPISPRRPSTTRRRSKRRWWCASRSPSWCRRRAGSARCAAIRPTFRGSRSRPTTGRSSPSRRRPRRRSWCSRPTAASTPSTPSKLPGGRGHGEPVRLYADMEQDARAGVGVPLSERAQVPGGEQDRPRLRGGRGRVPRQHPQGQAGAQRQAAGQGARRSRRSRASWRRRSARTARW